MSAVFSYIRKAHHIFETHERFIMPLAFLFGFVMDNLTLRRVDLWLENIALISYLFLAGAVILLFQAYNYGRIRMRVSLEIAPLLPFALQIVFGGLFSAFFVFYFRSASLSGSWFFILFLAVLLIGNEFFRKRYQRITFQLSVYFIALFSYLIFIVPVLLGRMGGAVFLLSGIASVVLIFLIFRVLRIVTSAQIERAGPSLYINIGCIYVIFHILYFANIIPPIPLSLTHAGVYHSIERDNGAYAARFEEPPWYLFFGHTSPKFHWVRGTPVYSYSSVFAPTKLRTRIVHHWSYFDEEKGEWVTSSKISFPVVGGRDGGYRGFTVKYGVRAGKWRVDVETERGQRLGRTVFQIIKTDFPSEFKETLLR